MSLAAILMIVVMLGGIFLGVPIAWALILSSLSAVIVGGISPAVLCQRLFTSMDATSMLAVPCFLVAGDIMGKGSISNRLVKFADSLFGTFRGGLAIVAIVTCGIFASLTGSALATAAAIGTLLIPAMTEKGYKKDYSTAIISIGGTLGPVIPPSIVFIFYAQATNLSVTKLFMSGVVPGIISVVLLSLMGVFLAIRGGMKAYGSFSFKRVVSSFKDAFLALLMPFIILGGIYCGIFTATESAAVAVIYGLIVSLFVYRDVSVSDLVVMFKNTAKTTANLMILIAAANVFGFLASYYNIPNILTRIVATYAPNAFMFMVLSGIILLICGMFMEATAVTVILAPILHPMALHYGVDPILFGCFMVFVLCIGIATPPFAPSMFVACGISKEPVAAVSKAIMPFVFVQIFVAVIIAAVPKISTWLPSLLGK